MVVSFDSCDGYYGQINFCSFDYYFIFVLFYLILLFIQLKRNISFISIMADNEWIKFLMTLK